MRTYWIDNTLMFGYAVAIVVFSYSARMTVIPQVAGASLGVLFLCRLVFGGERIPNNIEFILVGLWLVQTLLSGMFAIDQGLAFEKIITLVKVISVAFVMYCLMVWVGSVKSVLWGIILSTVVVSIVTLTRREQFSVGGRLVGTLGNANMYGLVLLLSIMACVYLSATSRKLFVHTILIGVTPFLFYVLVGTGSRKAFIGVLLLLVAVVRAKMRLLVRGQLVIGVGALVVLVIAFIGGAYLVRESSQFERLSNLYEAVRSGDLTRADESVRGRAELYREAIHVAMAHPIMGVGPDNFRRTKVDRGLGRAVGTYSHSNYMEVLVSTGFLGFALYYLVYVSIAVRILRLRRVPLKRDDAALYSLAGLVFVMYTIYDFAMVSYAEKASWLIFAMVFGSVQLVEQRCNSDHPQELAVELRGPTMSATDDMFIA